MVLKGSSAGPIIRLNARVTPIAAANSANDEIGGLIVGTSVHQGTAANSLVLSNIDDDGDIQMLVNDGGHSKEFLLADGDTAILHLGQGMASILLSKTISIAAGVVTGVTALTSATVDATTDFTIGSTVITDGVITDSSGLQLAAALDIDGDIDMGNYDINNVGASGNVWNDAQFIHKGSGNIVFQRQTATTNAEVRAFDLIHNSEGDVSDGCGPAFVFRQNDSNGGEEELGRISFVRAGADNTGDFRVSGGGSLGMKLTSAGALSVEVGSGTGTDGSTAGQHTEILIFDQYDDATELQRFAYSGEGVEHVVPEVTEEQRLANRERMVEMGILETVPEASSGYHMRIQPLTRLLAGGIYQNRHRMDSQYEELHKRLEAIGA